MAADSLPCAYARTMGSNRHDDVPVEVPSSNGLVDTRKCPRRMGSPRALHE